MASRNNIWANLDWLTIGIYVLLVFMGWINIYAAVFDEDHASILDMSQRYGKQLIWIIAAFVLAGVLILIDSKFYVSFAYPIYIVTILLLVAVLLIGSEVKGAKSWFQIGGFAFQPAEVSKLATALALAKFTSSYNFKIEKLQSILVIGAIICTPVALIFLQNDTGSALVFGVFAFVLYREGMSGVFLFMGLLVAIVFILTLVLQPLVTIAVITVLAILANYFVNQKFVEALKALGISASIFMILWLTNSLLKLEISSVRIALFSGIIATIIFAVYALRHRLTQLLIILVVYIGLMFLIFSVDYVFNNILEPHQRARIEELLGIKSDPLGVGYNVNQSKIAIGSGGMLGKGFLNGTQTKFNFVPEQSTDFIFCTVGEEWGFFGTTMVVLLFLGLLIRLVFLAERQRSVFSRVYGYSVACILFFHLAINVGMTIGLAPVIGIPLPFFSYGGSSLWSFTILLFIFLRLDASRMEKLSY
ncbi:rod shape-determining protein RodA [Mangrovibacterium diazotrophicum]|uniref:Cell wall polymerase n=1 Tax=Mangrovibacterium diazotrophicum TaxID=1261403 RepID=A0A419VVI7_9BACT|nr:rod shape-determining protein RodA [Mangrovibacterium diazotrophicum]RKD86174.1 rod shape determining protein RodA [Mangrovibacterium diazotrophicum]